MNDVFVEQIIECKQNAVTIMKKAGIVLAALTISFVVLFFYILRFLFPVTLGLCCWIGFLMIRSQNFEYEYSYTNGDLDIDKIIGRRKRFRVLSVRVRQFDILAPMTGEYTGEYTSKNIRRTIDASSSVKSPNRWFAKFTDNEGLSTLLIFEPNERILNAISDMIPNKSKWKRK